MGNGCENDDDCKNEFGTQELESADYRACMVDNEGYLLRYLLN